MSACDHPAAELLGTAGTTTFYRCLSCGAVLVGQGDRLWLIRPDEGSAGHPRAPTVSVVSA